MSFSFFWTRQRQPLFPLQQLEQQQHLLLFINNGTPATYSTKWEDLHPDSQRILLQIEEKILDYRDKSPRLDQSSRLYDYESSVSNDGFRSDASHIVQDLGGISAAMERPKILLLELMSAVKNMLHITEVAVHSFMRLRPKFLHPSKGNALTLSATAPSHTPGVTGMPSFSSHPSATSVVSVPYFYSGLPKKPSPSFLQQTVSRFEKNLGECRHWIEKLELLRLNFERHTSNNGSFSPQSLLSKVMANVLDIFICVATKVQINILQFQLALHHKVITVCEMLTLVESSIHQNMNSKKSADLAKQRRKRENDPFLETDLSDTARKEAASKRVCPTFHLPESSRPSTEFAVSFSISGTVRVFAAPHTSPLTSNSSGCGVSAFIMPYSASSSSSPLSLFSAPVSCLFGLSSATPQTSLFNSSSSLFDFIPSQFGSTAPSCGTTPGGSTFSTAFSSGAATGSGASIGSKSKRLKPETVRR